MRQKDSEHTCTRVCEFCWKFVVGFAALVIAIESECESGNHHVIERFIRIFIRIVVCACLRACMSVKRGVKYRTRDHEPKTTIFSLFFWASFGSSSRAEQI